MSKKRIDEEQVCIDSLCQHLVRHCGCVDVQLRREEDDPPDYWIKVDGTEFAAEVTSIVSNEALRARQGRLENDIRQAASEAGLLDWTYHLLFSAIIRLPRPNSAGWQSLVRSAVDALCRLQTSAALTEEVIGEEAEESITIVKGSHSRPALGRGGFDGAKWEGEAQEELQTLIQDAIDKKRGKLEKKAVSGSRAILLLYDAYGFGDSDDARKALARTNGYDWFHAVFWAASFSDTRNVLFPDQPGRRGVFLHSHDPTWQRVPASPKQA